MEVKVETFWKWAVDLEGKVSVRRVREYFAWVCFSSVLCDGVYQRSAVPGKGQAMNDKWRNRSEDAQCAVYSLQDIVKKEVYKA